VVVRSDLLAVLAPGRIRSYLPMCGLKAAFGSDVSDFVQVVPGGTRPRRGAPFARSDATGVGGPCGPTWTKSEILAEVSLYSALLRGKIVGFFKERGRPYSKSK
jgi:hypothetical protein